MPGGGDASVFADSLEIGTVCGVESPGLVMVVVAVRRDARCSWSWKAESSSLSAMGDKPVLISRDREPGRMRRVVVEMGFVAGPARVFARAIAGGGEILLAVDDAVGSARIICGPSI